MTAELQKSFAKHFNRIIKIIIREHYTSSVYPMCGKIKEVNWVITKTSLGDN